MVKACVGNKEKLIHYGAVGYGHNYSKKARDSFRARHRCSSAKDKLTARYWACKDLWGGPGGDTKNPPRRKSQFTKSSKFPSDTQIRQFIQNLNINYYDKDYVLKIWKKIFNLSEQAGRGKSRQDKTDIQVFKSSVDDKIKFLDQLTTDGSEIRFDALKEKYPQDITGDDIYNFIYDEKELSIELTSIVGADNKGNPCIDKCKLYDRKCMCHLANETQELSECHPQECGGKFRGFFSGLFIKK
jgi:hypothetical protein